MKDEEEISRMLASLRTVEASKDFERGVRSRIAEHREEPTRWRRNFILVAKFAVPLLLLIAVGGYLIVSNDRELSREMVPPVGNGTHDVASTEDLLAGPSGSANISNVNAPVTQPAVNRVGGNARPIPQGGSEDIGLSPDNSIVFPDGVDPRKAVITNVKPPAEGSISPVDVLLMIGISSNCSQKGCLATSLREGSIASTAGIQSGDLISAINGRPINGDLLKGRLSVSELTLIRSGRKTTITIGRP